MSEQLLNNWKTYIDEPDFQILRKFVDCLVSDETFEHDGKKIVCFKGCNGKTTLVNEIINLIGVDNVLNCPLNISRIDTRDYKLIVCQEYIPTYNGTLKQLSSNDNLWGRNGSVYVNKANILYVTNCDDDISLHPRTVTINFNHTFNVSTTRENVC